MAEINGYELSRIWFDWCFENPDKIKPNHTAMYFFIIEHCNRLGWKEKFGLPMEMTKDAIGISNYRTYSNTFEDLISWGFVKIYERSKNQYSATVIGLVKNAKAKSKALSKATQKHSQKQYIGIVGIDKPINLITLEPNNIYREFAHLSITNESFESLKELGFSKKQIDDILDSIENYTANLKYKNLFMTAKKWLEKDKEKNSAKKESYGANKNRSTEIVTGAKEYGKL